jgi:hypothetical protein
MKACSGNGNEDLHIPCSNTMYKYEKMMIHCIILAYNIF